VRTSYQSQRAEGPERGWWRQSRRRRGLLQPPPPQHRRRQSSAHQQIPTRVLPDGRTPTSAQGCRTGAKAGQPKNTNVALAARDVLGGPLVRAARQPPARQADSRTPPSGGRWHRKMHQSQRTGHAGADDACGRSAPRCRSPPLPLGRRAPSPLSAEGEGDPRTRAGGRAPAQPGLRPSQDDEDP
jgi:hypothetical protein